MHVFCNLSFQFEIRLYHMADNAFYRIFGCAIFGVLCFQPANANRFIPVMYNPVLDFECYPDDFLDSAFGTQWIGEFDDAEYGIN